jgi:uncharacterized protein
MYVLLSPAKSLDYGKESQCKIPKGSVPYFLDQTKSLHNFLKNLSEREIEEIMHISPQLARLNRQRFQQWNGDYTKHSRISDGTRNFDYALRAFDGDVYKNMNVKDYTSADWAYADTHIGILSGFYGLLSPLTYLKPYRLEMGTRASFTIDGVTHKNLYDFWGNSLSSYINHVQKDQIKPIVLNLASVEYAKAARLDQIKAHVVNVDFKVDRGEGDIRIVAIYAKQARGALADAIVLSRIETIENLRLQQPLGFRYSKDLSSSDRLVYIKKIIPTKK